MTWILVAINITALVCTTVDAMRSRAKMHRLWNKTANVCIDADLLVSFYARYFDWDKWHREQRGRGNTLYDQRTMLDNAYLVSRKALSQEYFNQTDREITRPEENDNEP